MEFGVNCLAHVEDLISNSQLIYFFHVVLLPHPCHKDGIHDGGLSKNECVAEEINPSE